MSVTDKSMYDIVQEVLGATTKAEAESILYGSKGMLENSQAFYSSIVSRFIKKKDIVVPKVSGKICFQLDDHVKSIWDLVFISQFVQTQFFDKYKTEIKTLELETDPAAVIAQKQVIRTTTIPKANIGSAMQAYEASIDVKKHRLAELKDKFNNFSWIDIDCSTLSQMDVIALNNHLIELKKALLIIHRFRNTFEHNEGVLSISDIISINNDKLEVRIPAEYLDGYTKGRIIVRDEDVGLIRKTNDIVYPILEKYDFDPRKIESFFYNVEPSRLSDLLEICNNDIEQLYRVPVYYFDTRTIGYNFVPLLKQVKKALTDFEFYSVDYIDCFFGGKEYLNFLIKSIPKIKLNKPVMNRFELELLKKQNDGIVDYIANSSTGLSEDDFNILNCINYNNVDLSTESDVKKLLGHVNINSVSKEMLEKDIIGRLSNMGSYSVEGCIEIYNDLQRLLTEEEIEFAYNFNGIRPYRYATYVDLTLFKESVRYFKEIVDAPFTEKHYNLFSLLPSLTGGEVVFEETKNLIRSITNGNKLTLEQTEAITCLLRRDVYKLNEDDETILNILTNNDISKITKLDVEVLCQLRNNDIGILKYLTKNGRDIDVVDKRLILMMSDDYLENSRGFCAFLEQINYLNNKPDISKDNEVESFIHELEIMTQQIASYLHKYIRPTLNKIGAWPNFTVTDLKLASAVAGLHVYAPNGYNDRDFYKYRCVILDKFLKRGPLTEEDKKTLIDIFSCNYGDYIYLKSYMIGLTKVSAYMFDDQQEISDVDRRVFQLLKFSFPAEYGYNNNDFELSKPYIKDGEIYDKYKTKYHTLFYFLDMVKGDKGYFDEDDYEFLKKLIDKYVNEGVFFNSPENILFYIDLIGENGLTDKAKKSLMNVSAGALSRMDITYKVVHYLKFDDGVLSEDDLKILEGLPHFMFLKEVDKPLFYIEYFKRRYRDTDKVVRNLQLLPTKIYDFVLTEENKFNIIRLIDRVNGEVSRLEEFPIELLSSDTEITEELGKYEYNICRSLFGINNPKIISVLLYMNNVLSKYDENIDFPNITLDPGVLLSNTVRDTVTYTSLSINQYEDSIEKDDHGVTRSPSGQAFNLMRKLRNSASHFRFKQVKNPITGEVDENLILIYDENNLGVLNYQGVFDINYLCQIVHDIENVINARLNPSLGAGSGPSLP